PTAEDPAGGPTGALGVGRTAGRRTAHRRACPARCRGHAAAGGAVRRTARAGVVAPAVRDLPRAASRSRPGADRDRPAGDPALRRHGRRGIGGRVPDARDVGRRLARAVAAAPPEGPLDPGTTVVRVTAT